MLLIFILFPYFLIAQWTSLPGPPGGMVYDLANDGVHVYAAVENGVYLLPQGATTWLDRSNGLSGFVYGVSAFHDTIAALTTTSAFYSTDAGVTWSSTLISRNQVVMCICRKQQRIFAGMDEFNYGYVQRSTNNGLTWTSCLSAGNTVLGIAINNNTVFAGTFSGQLYRSTNNGDDWTSLSFPKNYIGALFLDDSVLIAGGSEVIYRSTDNGANWTKSADIPRVDFRRIIKFGTIIYAAGGSSMNSSIYTSTNEGKTWHLHCNKIAGLGDVNQINGFIQKDSMLFVGSGAGLYSSIDSGKTWNLNNQGIARSSVDSYISLGSRLFATTDYNIMYSDDDGFTWISSMNGLPFYWRYSVCIYKSFLFAAGGPDQLYISSDSGKTWNKRSGSLNHINALGIATAGNNLILGTRTGVLISNDTGATWIQPSPGLNVSTYVNNIIVIDNLIFASVDMGFYRSTDGGINWTAPYLATSNPYQTVSHIVKAGQYLYGTVPGYYGLYKSGDYGANWYSLGLESIEVTSVTTTGNMIFAGTLDYGVLLSTNSGGNWYTLNDGLSAPSVWSMGIHHNKLYVSPLAHGTQIFPLELLGITAISSFSNIIHNTCLGQNYPNPFNASTVIPFSVKQRGIVRLKIFNLLGKEICTLVNQEHFPGSYSVNWNAANLSSGIYFCQLETSTQVETKKILLLK